MHPLSLPCPPTTAHNAWEVSVELPNWVVGMNFQRSPGHLSGSLNTDEGAGGRSDLGKKSLSAGHLVVWSRCPTQINPPLKANLSGAVGGGDLGFKGDRFSLGRGKGSRWMVGMAVQPRERT